MIRLFIIDDHILIREGLKKLFEKYSHITVAGESENTSNLIQDLGNIDPDILLLDITLQGRNGLNLIPLLRKEHPNTSVIILSMHPEERFALQAVKLGAMAYVTKDSDPEELVKAINLVYQGRRYFSQSVINSLLSDYQAGTNIEPHRELSQREYEVMCELALGNPVKEIASKLSISVPTVSTYRKRILEKMNMKKNSDLTIYAIHNNLID